MKFTQAIQIDNVSYQLINSNLQFDCNRPARAYFEIKRENYAIFEPKVMDVVNFKHGWDNQLNNVFQGYIESVNFDKNTYIVFCRDYLALIARPVSIRLRNATLSQVVESIIKPSKLQPLTNHNDEIIPYFYFDGNGLCGLDALKTVFNLDDLVIHLINSDYVYVGQEKNSIRYKKPWVFIPRNLIKIQTINTSTILLIPNLLPSMDTDLGRVEKIKIMNEQMEVTWKNASNVWY